MLTLVIPVKFYHPALEILMTQFNCKQAQESLGPVNVVIIGDSNQSDLKKLAARFENIMLIAPPAGGRGAALAKGGARIKQGWMLFVHADTCFQDDYMQEIAVFMKGKHDRAAYFKFKQDARGWKAWGLERLVVLRNALFALPYGDQGLLIHHELYQELGGFREDYPLFEDVDLVQKIGRKRLHKLPVAAVTSHERYKDGYLPRILLNMKCLWLYFVARKHPRDIIDIYLKR